MIERWNIRKKKDETYKIVCLTTYTYIYTHVTCLARLYTIVLRSNKGFAHSFVCFVKRRKKKSNQTLVYTCGFAAWDSINVFIVVKTRVNTIGKRKKIIDWRWYVYVCLNNRCKKKLFWFDDDDDNAFLLFLLPLSLSLSPFTPFALLKTRSHKKESM